MLPIKLPQKIILIGKKVQKVKVGFNGNLQEFWKQTYSVIIIANTHVSLSMCQALYIY